MTELASSLERAGKLPNSAAPPRGQPHLSQVFAPVPFEPGCLLAKSSILSAVTLLAILGARTGVWFLCYGERGLQALRYQRESS